MTSTGLVLDKPRHASSAPSAADSRESWAAEGPSRVSRKELPPSCARGGLLSRRFDQLIKRVFYCPEPLTAVSVRHIDPHATLLTGWSDFAAAFPKADVNVVVCDAPGEDDLAARLSELARSHRLPSVIVVTHLDVEHLLPFRRTPVEEFVPLASVARDLAVAMLRSVINPLRERLGFHVERLEHCGPELRFALARALRHPSRIRTIQQLAAAQGVTPRTLENQWKALDGGAGEMRLLDLLWMIRLLEALELRARGTSLGGICQELKVDLRSLQRACRRHLRSSLGRFSALEAAAELLRLRGRTLACLRGVETGRRWRRRQIAKRDSKSCSTGVRRDDTMLGHTPRAVFARGPTP